MNLKALLEEKKRLTEEKALADQNNSISAVPELSLKIETIDLLYQKLQAQYKTALLGALCQEVLFRLQCRVDEEKRWWWFSRTNATKVLSNFKKSIQNNSKTQKEKVSALRSALDGLNEIGKKKTPNPYESLFSSISYLAIQESFWSKKTGEENNQYTLSDPVITQLNDDLTSSSQKKDTSLLTCLHQQKGIIKAEKVLGLYDNEAYKKELDGAKREKIVREALWLNCPALSWRDASFPAASITQAASITSLLSSSLVQREGWALDDSVNIAIASLYGYDHCALPTKQSDLLAHVATKAGQGWFRRSLEYRTVEHLLNAAKKSSLTEADRVDVYRRISRLKKLEKFSSKNRDKQVVLNDIEKAFNDHRCAAYRTEMLQHFSSTGKQKELEDNIRRDEAVFEKCKEALIAGYELTNNSDNIVDILGQLKKDEKLPGQKKAVLAQVDVKQIPQTLSEIQERVFHVFYNHFQKDSASNGFQAFIPIQLKPEGGVEMLMSDGIYAKLLEILSPLFQASSALYYTTLLVSVALIRFRAEDKKSSYECLRQLFQTILNGSVDFDQLQKNSQYRSNSDLSWLLAYFPKNINGFRASDTVKSSLLVSFPDFEAPTVSTVLSGSQGSHSYRDSIESNSTTPKKKRSFLGFFSTPSKDSNEDQAQNKSSPLPISNAQGGAGVIGEVFTLMKDFMKTSRWASMVKETTSSSEKKVFVDRYCAVVTRLRCAVQGGESSSPSELFDLKFPSGMFQGKSLGKLFNDITLLLVRHDLAFKCDDTVGRVSHDICSPKREERELDIRGSMNPSSMQDRSSSASFRGIFVRSEPDDGLRSSSSSAILRDTLR